MLSSVYRYADLAYIGGGYNEGIHNTLEAAVYGIPVSFYGHDYHSYNEAVQMVELGAAMAVNNEAELAETWTRFLDEKQMQVKVKKDLAAYFSKNADATVKILSAIGL
jgi:3-deoxy-D-manno-octulosonic-acid transferase